MSEKMEFQTEAKQLLQLMIHSLYSHKEIFLRELISNASDALDKLRFEALTNSDISVDPALLKITITADVENRRLTISDNGVGMNHDELIANLGTIARSGSKAFLDNLSGDQKTDSNLIGQFGVGFYSLFMVAQKVEVLTLRAGTTQAYRWVSEGETTFEISDAARPSHGTDIIIHMNEGEEEYLQGWKLQSLVKKYSNFIAFPVEMASEEEDKKGEMEVLNNTKPIWDRNTSEVTPEEYEEFYQQACGGFGKTLKTIHSKAEGTMEYNLVAFIPEKLSPFERYNAERKHGMKLYVKKVFISDDIKELLPDYFRFVKGVVDSSDLPLNVSREILQDNPILGKIRKALTAKIFSELKKISSKDADVYANFWKEFGQIIKEGLHNDYENRDSILDVARFNSSAGDSSEYLTSFDDYISRMKDGQKHIYYITGENYDAVRKSPHMESLREKGIEVMYMTDPIDEFVIPSLFKVKEKELKSITDSDLDLGDLDVKDEEGEKKEEKRLKKFIGRAKEILGDMVSDVRLTSRLTQSPVRLVPGEGAMTNQMEKMMKAMGHEVPESKKVLELNSKHPVVNRLNELYENNAKSAELEDWTQLLYEQALIAEGQSVPDQAAYFGRINKLLESVPVA